MIRDFMEYDSAEEPDGGLCREASLGRSGVELEELQKIDPKYISKDLATWNNPSIIGR
jgi:hypothetical protein